MRKLHLLVLLSTSCAYGWQAKVFSGEAGFSAGAYGADSAGAYGYVEAGPNQSIATKWDQAGNRVSLHPPLSANSTITGARNGSQVGVTYVSGIRSASLWTGTAESWVNLNPQGSTDSVVNGVGGGFQAGFATPNGLNVPGYWQGTASSFTEIPSQGRGGRAWDTDGAKVVGFFAQGDGFMFDLATKQVTNMRPDGVSNAYLFSVDQGDQVGYVSIQNGPNQAAIWRGSADSYQSLNPEGASDSFAYQVRSGITVGSAEFGGQTRAGLWRGSADTWFDLHTFLPDTYSRSWASALHVDHNAITIVGTAVERSTGLSWATVWVQPVPEPGSLIALGAFSFALLRRSKR